MRAISLILRVPLREAVLSGEDGYGDEFQILKPSQMTGKQRESLASLPVVERTTDDSDLMQSFLMLAPRRLTVAEILQELTDMADEREWQRTSDPIEEPDPIEDSDD